MEYADLSRLCDSTNEIESSHESIQSDDALFDMAALESADQSRASDEVATALSTLHFDDAAGPLDDSKYAIGGTDDGAGGLPPESEWNEEAALLAAGISEPTAEALISVLLAEDSHAIQRHSPDVDIRARIRTGVDEAGNAAPASTSSRFNSYSTMLSCLHATMQAISQEMNDVMAICALQIQNYKTARVALYEAYKAGSKVEGKRSEAETSTMLAHQKASRETLLEARNALKAAVQHASSMLPLTTLFPNERSDAKRDEAPRSPPLIRVKPNRQVTLRRTFSVPIGMSIRQKRAPLGEEASVSMDDLPIRFYKPVAATRSVTVFRTADDPLDLDGKADVGDVMARFKLTTSYPDLEQSEGWSGSDPGTSGSDKEI